MLAPHSAPRGYDAALEAAVEALISDASGGDVSVPPRNELAESVAKSLHGFDVFGATSFLFGDVSAAAAAATSSTASLDGVVMGVDSHNVGGLRVACDGVPDRLCVNVSGLLPGHTYTFRVAALAAEEGAWLVC